MSSRCADLLVAVALAAAVVSAPPAADARALRVCADPNNLPFTNQRGEGFENRLVELVARELGMTVEYTWWASRRGFLRNTLKAGLCDVVPGVPASLELVLATRPYYRSSYVFVTRRDRELRVASFDDPQLRTLRVGVPLVGDGGASSPPGLALAARHVVANVVGFPVYGDYAEPNPPARLVDAVARGDVDVAVVWGPLAGWAAQHASAPLVLVPVSPQIDRPFLPMVFDVAMGVRHEDTALRDDLDGVLRRRRADVDAILAAYGVPRVDRREGSP